MNTNKTEKNNKVNFKQIQKEREGKNADELEADYSPKIKFSKLHSKQLLLTIFLIGCIVTINQLQFTNVDKHTFKAVALFCVLNLGLIIFTWQAMVNKIQEQLEIGKHSLDVVNAASNFQVSYTQAMQMGLQFHTETCSLEEINEISVMKTGSEKPFTQMLQVHSNKWKAVVEESHDKQKVDNDQSKIKKQLYAFPSIFSHYAHKKNFNRV